LTDSRAQADAAGAIFQIPGKSTGLALSGLDIAMDG
jgi:hypothetical protein